MGLTDESTRRYRFQWDLLKGRPLQERIATLPGLPQVRNSAGSGRTGNRFGRSPAGCLLGGSPATGEAGAGGGDNIDQV